MIGLALSGGGSRAVAFHLGCLRALNDLGILDKVNILSTISGGSIIGAYYAYMPGLSFSEFEKNIRRLLSSGIQRRLTVELVKPTNMVPCLFNLTRACVQEVLRRKLPVISASHRYPSRTDMFCKVLERDLFPGLTMSSPRRHGVDVVIGATELRTGTAFRFSNQRSGDWRHGELVESSVPISLAVGASAAYPILLPALDREWLFQRKNQRQMHRILLSDGGVYDNLGLQVLEPGRDSTISIFSFACDYLISCNAGHGQDSGDIVPLTFASRVARAFEIIHRRVQDSAMNRLHLMKEAGQIKGFVLPYLGQQDSRLPWRPTPLVSREEVVAYPTDFAAMTGKWIEKLSARGEQLTRFLVSYYLPELIC